MKNSNGRIIGIDVGGTNFRIGAVSAEGDVTQFRKIPADEVFSTEDALTDLLSYLTAYRAELAEDIDAVSIGFPATINRERTKVLQAPNLPFMENLPVVPVLSQKLGVPAFLERDVTMALCYDMAKYNGKLLIGRNGTAGELGHIPVDGSEIRCGCGNVGCMENLAGGKYLAHLQAARYPDTPVGELFALRGEDEDLRQFVERMAQAIATEINILDPDHVLIGGGVVAMQDFPTDMLSERIYVHVRKPYPANNLEILFTADECEKGVIGAAYYAKMQSAL